VDLDMLMEQVDDITQFFLGVSVVRPNRLEGDKVDDRGEFVLDPMIKLVQQGSSLKRGRMGDGMGHSGLS
jgi:hypothetical protein